MRQENPLTDRQELDDLLTAVLDRHIAENPTLVTDFGSVFGADATDTAAQWLVHYLNQYTGHIEALTATTAEPTAVTGAQAAVPLDQAAAELLADIRTIADDAVAAVPEAALLSPAEVNRVLMEVLAEDDE